MTAAERTRAYRQRIMADAAEIERRKRACLERNGNNSANRIGQPTVVLVAWHRDDLGCMARTVGCA